MKTQRLKVVLLSAAFLFLVKTNCSIAQVLETDSLALVDLFNATNGPGWRINTNWLTGPVDTWYGVTVAVGRVTELRLSGINMTGKQDQGDSRESYSERFNALFAERLFEMDFKTSRKDPLRERYFDLTLEIEEALFSELYQAGSRGNLLSGSLPSSIGNLTQLLVLDLDHNRITGPIPSTLGNLEQLQDLDLINNQLSENIPTELGNLRDLQYLHLGGNKLSGTIPEALGSLANLEFLSLSGNSLTGSIPEALGSLANLEFLSLSGNGLIGTIPEALGSLANLEFLSLSGNGLTGSIPGALDNLASLQHLNLGGNYLTGIIPTALGNLANLQHLSLGQNQLSGSIPGALGNLIQLKDLYLFSNELTGEITGELANLANLEKLILSGNKLAGNIPEAMGNLHRLRRLDVSSNLLTGSIPASLGNLQNIERLSLSGNLLTGSIPGELGNLANLEYLGICFTYVTDPIPDELGQLKKLKWLILSNNRFSGNIPVAINQLYNLKHIDLSDNQFSGSIPEGLAGLYNLEYLEIDNNQLTGSIPAAFGTFRRLRQLHLGYNQLSGGIPEEMGDIPFLQKLYLHGNQLEGSIPASFGNLYSLTDLNLSDNQLSGHLPGELGRAIHLYHLYLFENKLTGRIPESFGQLTNLRTLNLSYNLLTGNIPTELGNLINLVNLDLSHNQLSGTIPVELGRLTELRYLQLNDNNLSGIIPYPVVEGGISAYTCRFNDNDPNLCIPDTSPYREIGSTSICGIPLSLQCSRPIILIHDHGGSPEDFGTLASLLLNLGRSVKYYNYENTDCPIETVASQLNRSLRSETEIPDIDDYGLEIIAHGMGGLVARYFISHFPNSVSKLITLATPHYGTYAGNQADLIPFAGFNAGTQAKQMALGSSFIWDLHHDWEHYLGSATDPPEVFTIVATLDGIDRQAHPCDPVPPSNDLPFYCAYTSDEDPYDNMDGLVPLSSQNLLNVNVPAYFVPYTHSSNTGIAYVTSKDHKTYDPIVAFLSDRIPETPSEENVLAFAASDNRISPQGNLLLELYDPGEGRLPIESVEWSDEQARGDHWGLNEESGLYFASMVVPGTHTLTIHSSAGQDEPVTRKVEILHGRTSVYRFVNDKASDSATITFDDGRTGVEAFGETGIKMAFSSGPGGMVNGYRFDNKPSGTDNQVLPYYWEIVSSMPAGSFSANITLSYEENDVVSTSLSEENLVIAAFDDGWQILDSSVNQEKNEISANVTRFSLFAIGTDLASSTGTEENHRLPSSYALSQNYPNPFNHSTTITYMLPESGTVSLVVYDVIGRQVRKLAEGPYAAGKHQVLFDTRGLPSGLYLYRIEAGPFVEMKYMMLVR